MTKGKWNRPEDQIESSIEAKYWFYLFRILFITGFIGGIISTIINLIAFNSGVMTENESGILFLPYSFLAGFVLTAVLILWIIILLFGLIIVAHFFKVLYLKFFAAKSSLN
ncbi:MAG: hypothetical protein FK731_09940 [Asgard group archaeon]|nr:hypothetical protein [Asgard group archaeon]